MRQARRSFLALVGVVIVLLAAPAGALAADSVTVTGTVVRDGAPVTGVEVVVAIPATGIIVSTATDENGGFTVDLEAGVGSELEIHATGKTSRTGPDAQGCVRSETPIGDLDATIESVPPAPLTVELSTVLTSKVCSETGKPEVTPPATDGAGVASGGSAGAGLLLVLGLLCLAGAGALVARPRARG